MKKIIFPIAVLTILAACSSNKAADKKSELEKLKKQQTALTSQIAQLEKEMGVMSPEDAARNTKNVAVLAVQGTEFKHYIDVQGKVDGDESVTLSPQIPGMVAKINVVRGQQVRKGQVLAELDNRVMAQGIQELKTQLAFVTNLFEKQKNLWERKIGSEMQYLTAKNNKESLELKLATMNDQLDLTRIKSPINGTVDALDIKLGQTVAPGLAVMRVVNLSKLKVKAEVAESYINKIKKGDDVELEFPDAAKKISTKLSYSAKAIDNLNRTFGVEVLLAPSSELHPNMVVAMHIVDYTATNAIVVPLNVVQKSANENFVFLADNNHKAQKVTVTIGKTYNGQTEILSGLKFGDKVITTGFQDLNEGEALRF